MSVHVVGNVLKSAKQVGQILFIFAGLSFPLLISPNSFSVEGEGSNENLTFYTKHSFIHVLTVAY